MVLNLSNFIHSLLLENETVIIPGFGAFISTYKPAEIIGNEIKPPSKEISFNKQIKNNDGRLVEIIARKAKISQNNALKRIEKARENMLYELDKGETVILENIGSLSYNEKNDIRFIPFQKDNLLLDSFGLETISKEDSIEETDEVEINAAVIQDTTEPDVEPEIHMINEGTDEIENELSVQQVPDETDKDSQPLIITGIEKENGNTPEPEPLKFSEFKPVAKDKKQEERKKKVWLWYLLILIPVLIVGYFVFNNKPKSNRKEIIQQNIKFEQPETQDEKITTTDSISNDSAQIAEEAEVTENVIQESAQQQGNNKYYLVGGGFEMEENAEKYILQLKEKGIKGFRCGKKGRLFLVGIESFDTEEEAVKSLNEHFKTDPDWILWIFKK